MDLSPRTAGPLALGTRADASTLTSQLADVLDRMDLMLGRMDALVDGVDDTVQMLYALTVRFAPEVLSDPPEGSG